MITALSVRLPRFLVEFSGALSAELAVLTEALSEPGVDLQEQVQKLGQTVRAAVSSYVGVSMTVVVEGYPFTVTALDITGDPVVIGASVSVPLGTAHRTGTTSSVVFYAATPGAFVDLAADVTVALHLDPGVVVVDPHRDDPDGAPVASGSTGWSQVSIVNQAIGVLIGEGRTPARARAALDGCAVSTGVDVVGAARAVMASTGPQHPDHDDGPAERSHRQP